MLNFQPIRMLACTFGTKSSEGCLYTQFKRLSPQVALNLGVIDHVKRKNLMALGLIFFEFTDSILIKDAY